MIAWTTAFKSWYRPSTSKAMSSNAQVRFKSNSLKSHNNGVKRPIGKWLVDDGTLRKTWKTGLFSQGYQITLPWQQPPASSKLRVVARLQTLDGRTFEAERDFEATINKNAAASLANLGGAFTTPSPVHLMIAMSPRWLFRRKIAIHPCSPRPSVTRRPNEVRPNCLPRSRNHQRRAKPTCQQNHTQAARPLLISTASIGRCRAIAQTNPF